MILFIKNINQMGETYFVLCSFFSMYKNLKYNIISITIET